jgi:uncharacterized protein YndB with AHSA1/START domain
MSDERIEVTRRIAAPARAIFAVVSDPEGHVEIDGSGMLEAAPDARRITAAGQTFAMDMDREPLGDVPLGKYQVTNRVTRFVPDRLVEWTVGLTGNPGLGHVYGWQLEPVQDDETDVTNYCDWSGLPDEARERTAGRWPIVPVEMLERSVENLDRIVTTRA